MHFNYNEELNESVHIEKTEAVCGAKIREKSNKAKSQGN